MQVIRIISEVTPSLYLRQFVPNSCKDIPAPVICFAEIDGAAGLYYHPEQEERELGTRAIDLSRGLILCGEYSSEDTIAHEWRHHWQHMNGIKYDGKPWNPSIPYWDQLKDYFTRSWSEMDALKFAWKQTGYIYEPWQDELELVYPSEIGTKYTRRNTGVGLTHQLGSENSMVNV